MTTVLHAGLPKTGTTTLQRHVFSTLEGPECYLNSGGTKNGAFMETIRALERCRREQVAELRLKHEDLLARAGKPPLLVSHENFTFPRKTDIVTAPQRLKSFFGDARVVIVIRNQPNWLESYYFYHQAKEIKRGKVEEPTEFVSREASLGSGGVFGATHYFDLWQSWADAFGPEQVTFLPYELLKENAGAFFSVFSEPLEQDPSDLVTAFQNAPRENTRLTWGEYFSGVNTTRIRKKAPWIYQLLKHTGIRLHDEAFVADDTARFDFTSILPPETIAKWAEQNRRLSETLSLDLGRFGYVGF